MKFSALNVDFDGPSFDFLGSSKSAHESSKELYFRKSRYFTVVSQSFMKTAADRHVAYHNKHWWRAFQSYQHRWLWKTLNFQNKGFYWFLRSSAAAHTSRMNCDKMAGDRLTVYEQAFARFVSISTISCFLNFFFAKVSPSAIGRSPRNFTPWLKVCRVWYHKSKNLGALPKEIMGAKFMQTWRDFEPLSIWPGILFPKQMEIFKVKKLIDRQRFFYFSRVRGKKTGKLKSTNYKILYVHFDSPKLTFSENHI